MALLNRLFSSRKKQQQQRGYVSPLCDDANLQAFQYSKEQVRILLFRECERRGRKLLFDSKAVRKVSLPNPAQCGKLRFGYQSKAEQFKKPESPFVEISNGYGYQYTRPGADVKPLGEMIFGSVAMALRGPTFKVHIGSTPPVLMVTKVSHSPARQTNDRNLEDSYGSSLNSMSEFFSGSSSSDSKLCKKTGSFPLDVPHASSLTVGLSQFFVHHDASASGSMIGQRPDSLEADSGCYTAGQWAGGLSNPASPDSRKSSGGSLSSLRQQWLRTASTSLDLDSSVSFAQSDPFIPGGEERATRRTKLGMAIVISLTLGQKVAMQNFLLEHGAILESIMVRLHAAVERAYCRKESFVSMMMDASCDVEQSVEDLIVGPRLSNPVWLGLLPIGGSSLLQRSTLSATFLQEMCHLLETCDTKDTNFFMSTLVTAVLTHHLGWVSTVMPFSSRLSELPKLHPYNPLWAQAMDLYGALGYPLKTARTIVMSVSSGKSRTETIEKFLHILSYFIRCAGIGRSEPKIEDANVCWGSNQGSPAPVSSGHLSAENRAASLCTLRPVSGDCTPVINYSETATHGNASEASSSSGSKPLLIMDCASSKSENSLNIATNVCDESEMVKSDSKGLRRTVSYTAKMSVVAKLTSSSSNSLYPKLPTLECSTVHPDMLSPQGISLKVSRLCRIPTSAILCHLTPPLPQKMVAEVQCSSSGANSEQKSISDKVVFVLGDNENLVGLKSNQKTRDDSGKIQQPLSFSGSEVESGFSECESYELSPVCSISENGFSPKLKTNGRSTIDSKNSTNQLLSAERTCLSDLTNCMQASPTCDPPTHRVVTVHSSVIDIDNDSKTCGSDTTSCPSDAWGLRSLARSVSVNLPVCLKLRKPDGEPGRTCLKCGETTTVQDHQENKPPLQGTINTTHKKLTHTLCRTQSSCCVLSCSEIRSNNPIICRKCYTPQSENDGSSCSPAVKKEKNISPLKSSQQPESDVLSPQNEQAQKPILVELPMPRSTSDPCSSAPALAHSWGIASSLLGGVSSHYVAERVLQGCAPLAPGWERTLKRDLTLNAQHHVLDPGLSEAVAIVANIDTWEVQLMSSHTYVVDRPGALGVRIGLSQIVANMLEALLHMWKLHASPELCLTYLEGRLREIWARSRALSELLLSTEFCDMDLLTSSLSLDANDVPLLLAVAATHSPEVTQRYGLCFR